MSRGPPTCQNNGGGVGDNCPASWDNGIGSGTIGTGLGMTGAGAGTIGPCHGTAGAGHGAIGPDVGHAPQAVGNRDGSWGNRDIVGGNWPRPCGDQEMPRATGTGAGTMVPRSTQIGREAVPYEEESAQAGL